MIEIKNLSKVFYTKEREFIALDDVSTTFNDGELIAILGESGSGKSTLLNMISGIDNYTEGEITIDGLSTKDFDDTKWRKFRNKNIGFVFQRYNLVEHLTVRENIILPLMYSGEKKEVINGKAKRIIEEVGLTAHASKPANLLSGGEKQRIAIARSMLSDPRILLCDEPTGALDSSTAQTILMMIRKIASKDRTVILVTHDEKIATEYADRIIRIHDGVIISDERLTRTEAIDVDDSLSKRDTFKTATSDYKKVNRRFSRFIGKANYRQNKASNMKIVTSFLIGLSILFMINLVLSNVVIYNKTMFERNNDYERFYVDDYTSDALIDLDEDPLIGEVGTENRYLIENSYLNYLDATYESTYVHSINQVHQVVLETMPDELDYFYLQDQILAESKQKLDQGVYVSTELLYNHYLNMSLDTSQSSNKKENKQFFKDYPIQSFIDESIYICGDSDDTNCFEATIIGIIDSNMNGVNYANKIFIKQAGFTQFIHYLENDLGYTSVNHLYKSRTYFYYQDFSQADHESLAETYGMIVTNSRLDDYQQLVFLEKFANFVIMLIIAAIFIIFGTVVINIISFNITSRTKDIGVYTSVGVSRKTIRGMFINETWRVLRLLIGLLVLLYAVLIFIFQLLYIQIITYNYNLIHQFKETSTLSYEIVTFIVIIIMTTALYLISVYIPAYRVSRKKAIETLSW